MMRGRKIRGCCLLLFGWLCVQANAAPQGDGRMFVETEVDDRSPYVQQSVGVTVRLFYAVPLASGQLDLDAPADASLQKVGEDAQSSREINGRRYSLVERRFLLVPERSGPLTLPAARFSGRGAGGWMDDLLGGNSRPMSAVSQPQTLQVQPQPAHAAQPWLPLQDLRMRYLAAPQSLRAGEAATLSVEITAQGATQAQMPELPTPSLPGAQVFAEPPQYDESFVGGRPQLKLTRRYSIVPNRAGDVRIPGMRLAWWDVDTDTPQTAALPDLALKVLPGVGGFARPAPTAVADDAARSDGTGVDGSLGFASPAQAGTRSIWVWLTVGFALLWLLTLIWALQRRAIAAPAPRAHPNHAATPAAATHTLADMKRALDTGTLDEVGDALRGMAIPPAADLDALLSRLQSPQQQQAIEQLRRARWAEGDGVAARAALRQAFRMGPAWKAVAMLSNSPLPPLYPAP